MHPEHRNFPDSSIGGVSETNKNRRVEGTGIMCAWTPEGGESTTDGSPSKAAIDPGRNHLVEGCEGVKPGKRKWCRSFLPTPRKFKWKEKVVYRRLMNQNKTYLNWSREPRSPKSMQEQKFYLNDIEKKTWGWAWAENTYMEKLKIVNMELSVKAAGGEQPCKLANQVPQNCPRKKWKAPQMGIWMRRYGKSQILPDEK